MIVVQENNPHTTRTHIPTVQHFLIWDNPAQHIAKCTVLSKRLSLKGEYNDKDGTVVYKKKCSHDPNKPALNGFRFFYTWQPA